MKQKERKGRKKKKSIRVNLDLEWFNYFDYSRRDGERQTESDDCMMRRKAGEESERERERKSGHRR